MTRRTQDAGEITNPKRKIGDRKDGQKLGCGMGPDAGLWGGTLHMAAAWGRGEIAKHSLWEQ